MLISSQTHEGIISIGYMHLKGSSRLPITVVIFSWIHLDNNLEYIINPQKENIMQKYGEINHISIALYKESADHTLGVLLKSPASTTGIPPHFSES